MPSVYLSSYNFTLIDFEKHILFEKMYEYLHIYNTLIKFHAQIYKTWDFFFIHLHESYFFKAMCFSVYLILIQTLKLYHIL